MENPFQEIVKDVTIESHVDKNDYEFDFDSITAEAYEGLSTEAENVTDIYAKDLYNVNAMLFIEDSFTTESVDNTMNALFKANGFDDLDFADMTVEEVYDTEVVELDTDDVDSPKAYPLARHDYRKAEEHNGTYSKNNAEYEEELSHEKDDSKEKPKRDSKLVVFAKKVLRGFLNMVDKLIIFIKKWFAKISLMLVKSLDKREELLKKIKEIGEKKINKIEVKDGIVGWASGFISRQLIPSLDKLLTSNDLMTIKASTARGIMSMTSSAVGDLLPSNIFNGNIRQKLGQTNNKDFKNGFDGKEAMFVVAAGGLLHLAPDNSYITGESKRLSFIFPMISSMAAKAMMKGDTLANCGGINMKSMEFYLTLDKKIISKNLDSIYKSITEHKNNVKSQIEEYEKNPNAKHINTVKLTALSNRRNALLFKSVSSQIGLVNDAVAMAKFIIKKSS